MHLWEEWSGVKAARVQEHALPRLAEGVAGFHQTHQRLPESFDELVVAGVLGDIPVDPWGMPYQYERMQRGARLMSYGADRDVGGDGSRSDLVCALEDLPVACAVTVQ